MAAMNIEKRQRMKKMALSGKPAIEKGTRLVACKNSRWRMWMTLRYVAAAGRRTGNKENISQRRKGVSAAD